MSSPAIVIEDTRPTKPCQKFEGHTGWVKDVIHLPDGQQIMTCSLDGSLGVWNLQTGKRIANWQDGEDGVISKALSVDGKKVVSGGYGDSVKLWNMETGKVLAKCTGHTQEVWSVCWNRDDERVLSGSSDGTIRVWGVENGKTILEINTGLDEVITATFSPDSTLIATGGNSSEDERIGIWDANTGKLVTILKGHARSVYCLAWTADGRMLISGSTDYTIRTWNTSTWQQLAVLKGHTDSVRGIAISPNGRILASASYDHTAQLWNLENGQAIGLPLRHPDDVTCVSFSTDGMLLATGCEDTNAYTWNVSEIIKEAGSSELLDGEKSFLHANATRRPIQQPKVHIIPTNFFAESPPHPDPAIIRPTSPPIESLHDDAPPEEVQPSSLDQAQHGFFAWLHRITPAQSTFLQRARLHFFRRPQRHHHEGVELQERPPSIVNVPLAQGLLRYANETGVRRMREKKKKKDEDMDEAEDEDETDEKEKAKQATIAIGSKNAMNAVPTSPPPPTQSNVAQPSAGLSRPKRSAELHPTTFTSPADATTSIPNTSTPLPGAVTLRAGCCTRLLLCTGCVSRYHDGHH